MLDHDLDSSWNDIVTQIQLLVCDPAAAFRCGRKHPNRLLVNYITKGSAETAILQLIIAYQFLRCGVRLGKKHMSKMEEI